MNMSQVMKLKQQIQASCGIESKMLDVPEVGFVLIVERKSIDIKDYKLLANFVAEHNLSLQLEIGNFIISDQPLGDRLKPSGN